MTFDWDAAASTGAVAQTASVLLGRHWGGGLEGIGASGQPEHESVARLEEALAQTTPALPPGAWDDVRDRLLAGAHTGLAKLNQGAAPESFTVAEHAGLESVILTNGTRPSLFVRKGTIDLDAPDTGEWKGALRRSEEKIRQVIGSVGRIDVPISPGFVGTGFVIAEGLVLTNRHVLEHLAVENTPGVWVLRWPDETRIDFVGEDAATDATAFKVTGVAFVGPDRIADTINFAHLDAAVLRVDPATDAGHAFPPPVAFATDIGKASTGRDLYVVGYPGKPMTWMFEGVPPTGFETTAVLSSVFNAQFDVKRLAPGTVTTGPGNVAGDDEHWILAHDASTLGGSSGSCLADLTGGGLTVIGLHFGGMNRKQNWAHAAATLQQRLSNLTGGPAA